MNPGDFQYRRHHALDVLYVHGREHIDSRVEKIDHVLVTLGVLAALDIGMGQFVDQRDRGLARENRLYIHLLEGRAAVLNHAAGDGFELLGQFRDSFSPVGLDHSHHDIFAATVAANAFAEHIESLAHAGRIAQQELENCRLLLGLGFFQPLLGCLGHV